MNIFSNIVVAAMVLLLPNIVLAQNEGTVDWSIWEPEGMWIPLLMFVGLIGLVVWVIRQNKNKRSSQQQLYSDQKLFFYCVWCETQSESIHLPGQSVCTYGYPSTLLNYGFAKWLVGIAAWSVSGFTFIQVSYAVLYYRLRVTGLSLQFPVEAEDARSNYSNKKEQKETSTKWW